MSSSPSSSVGLDPAIEPKKTWTVLRTEYMELEDATVFARKLDKNGKPSTQWTRKPASGSISGTPAQAFKKLFLVLQNQAPGEPKHWSLFVAPGDSREERGTAWQVKGDALFMHHQHANNVAVFSSDSFFTYYILNDKLTEDQERKVAEAATKQKAPSAPNQAAVVENCQGWTIRVLRVLQEEGIVEKEKVDKMERDVKEPIRK